jgi:hypothetical protein
MFYEIENEAIPAYGFADFPIASIDKSPLYYLA